MPVASPVRLTVGTGASPWLQLAGMLPRVSPPLAAGVIALTVTEAITPNLRSIAGGLVVGAVAAGGSIESRSFHLSLVALAVAFLLQFALISWRSALSDALARRFMRWVMERQMRAMLRPPTVAHLEDPDMLDQMERARNTGLVGPGAAANAVVNQVAMRLRGLIALAIFAAFDWRFALLMLATFYWRIDELAGIYRQILPIMWGRTSTLRRSDYLRNVAMGPAAAKELRVFGLASWTVDRLRRAWLSGMEPVWQERRGTGWRLLAGNLPAIVVVAATFAVLARAALRHEIGLAALTVYVQCLAVAFNNLGGNGGDPFMDAQVEYGAAGLAPLRDVEAAVAAPRLLLPGARPAAELPRRELRFEGLTFRYPSQARDVLDRLDLTIPAGGVARDRRR